MCVCMCVCVLIPCVLLVTHETNRFFSSFVSSSLLTLFEPCTMLSGSHNLISNNIGRTSQVDAALLMADLNANHITLLPFTIDHLGGLGHFTQQ